jgi:hypothetical protein
MPPRLICASASLVGGEAIPLHGLGVILRHPPAFVVRETEIELRDGVTLVG